MNKLNKIGLSALCGSLAAVGTVNAGELEVLGSAELSWTTKGGEVTGNPLGMNTGLTFKGSGELDGGQTFSVSIVHTDKATWSSSNITLNTNTMGKFVLSSAEGSQGIGGYDDITPTAWEETWDNISGLNINLQKGVGSSTNISWTTPSYAGTSFQVALAPDNDGAQNANKAVSGETSNHFGHGYDLILDISPDWDTHGFQLMTAWSETELAKWKGVDFEDLSGNHQEAIVAFGLDIGPMSAGVQVSGERMRGATYNVADFYGNTMWGVAINVNDDLSFSFGEARSIKVMTKKGGSGTTGVGASAGHIRGTAHTESDYIPKARMKGESWQVAYTIGGVAIKYADTSWDNTGYKGLNDSGKVAAEARTISVSMAF